MTGTRQRAMLMAVAALVTMALAACSASRTDSPPNAAPSTNDTATRANKGVVESAEKPTVGGKIVYGLFSETNGWNPGTNQWAPSGMKVARAVFEHFKAEKPPAEPSATTTTTKKAG